MRSIYFFLVFALSVAGYQKDAALAQPFDEDAATLRYEQVELPNLRDTGLYRDDGFAIAEGIEVFTPRFPLYADTLQKRRFIALPDGSTIDASRTETWEFPVGTKIWKEFSLTQQNRRIETRYMEKAEERWLFGVYVWNEDQSEASLWSGAAIPNAANFQIPGPSGMETVTYKIPSFQDCLSCHVQESALSPSVSDPVLGFQAVQLDRNYLQSLLSSGDLTNLTLSMSAHDILARNPRERAAIGYIHGNCAHCHNPRRPDVVRPVQGRIFALDYNIATVRTWQDVHLLQLINRPVTDQSISIPGVSGRAQVIKPRFPEHSMLFYRMAVVVGPHAMPRIGVASRDYEALNNVIRPWIQTLAP